MSHPKRPDGSKEAPFTYRMSPAEAKEWDRQENGKGEGTEKDAVRSAARGVYPHGYVRIVYPGRGRHIAETFYGGEMPPKPKRQPPAPKTLDTFEAVINEAINWLTAAQSAERNGNRDETKRCVSAARDEIHQAEMLLIQRAE